MTALGQTVSGVASATIPIPRFTPREPVAFAKKRTAAYRALERLAPPSDKKYTNWARHGIAERFAGKAIGTLTPHVAVRSYEGEFKPMGVSLRKAVNDWPEHVAGHLLGPALPVAAHYFSALSGALWKDGAVIVVPSGTKAVVDLSFPAESGSLSASRTVIVVKEGAELELFEHGTGGGEAVLVRGIEAYVEDGAKLSYRSLADWDATATDLAVYRGRVGRNARLDWLAGSFGGSFSQVSVESALVAAGAETDVHGIYFGSAAQHFEQELVANHAAGRTTSDTYARGVCRDTARAVYRGMIRIAKGAHGSAADQNGHAMLLSERAHVDAIPGLEIDADDVIAGHGATVGQLDEEQLFYLMSRGLSRTVAERLIVSGFLQSLLADVDLRTRALYQAAIDARLSRA